MPIEHLITEHLNEMNDQVLDLLNRSPWWSQVHVVAVTTGQPADASHFMTPRLRSAKSLLPESSAMISKSESTFCELDFSTHKHGIGRADKATSAIETEAALQGTATTASLSHMHTEDHTMHNVDFDVFEDRVVHGKKLSSRNETDDSTGELCLTEKKRKRR